MGKPRIEPLRARTLARDLAIFTAEDWRVLEAQALPDEALERGEDLRTRERLRAARAPKRPPR